MGVVWNERAAPPPKNNKNNFSAEIHFWEFSGITTQHEFSPS